MYKIGLTGGIASGKSTVVNWLLKHGAVAIDADLVAREVVEPGTPGLAALRDAFGDDIVTTDGTLDRAALGAIVFTDEAKRKQLNALLHGFIKEAIDAKAKQLEAQGYAAAIYDIPLLIETEWYKDMDEVWLVYVSPETQLHRLMERNGYSEEEASHRIASQMSFDEKRPYGDQIIDNNGTPEELEQKLRVLWNGKKHLFALQAR